MPFDTAVVLAGGPASRLRPLSDETPKALIKLCGKPILQWIIEWLRDNSVQHIVIGVAHLKDRVIEYFGNGSKFGVDLKYSIHTVEGGTSQGFLFAIKRYVDTENFFAMNGDQITDLNLLKLGKFHLKHRKIATIAVSNPICPFGHIKVDKNQDIIGFLEKPKCSYAVCNTGIYAFNRSVLDYLAEKGDVEKITFPTLGSRGDLKVYPFRGFFVTVNTIKDIEEAEKALRERYNHG